MAREALTKADLRDDPLKDWFFRMVDYVHKRRGRFIAGGSLALAVIVAGVAVFLGMRISAQHMAARFNDAERLTLRSEGDAKEAAAKSREAFQTFVKDYPDATLTPYAWLHLAAAASIDGKPEETEAALRQVVDFRSTPPSLRAIATNALAKIYEDKGEWEKSAVLYRGMQQDRFGDLAEFSLGRVSMAGKKPEEARQHLKAVEEQHPQSTLATLARDVLNFVHE